MRAFLDFAEGPLFRFAFAVMVLGLARLVVIAVRDIARMRARTPDQSTDIGAMVLAGLRWMSPARWLFENRAFYTAASLLFHVGLIVVPIFFLPHVTLWQRGTGLSWPSLSSALADALTIMTVVAGVVLVVLRASDGGSRQMSHPQDWLLTPLCILVFASGWLAAHPESNPFAYTPVRLVHVLAGNLLLVLVPFTKLAHVVLLPFTHVMTDLGWKLVPGVGRRVREALGNPDRPV